MGGIIMHVILGLIYLGLAGLCIYFIFLIRKYKPSGHKSMICLMAIAVSIGFGLGLIQFIKALNKPKQYSASEYHLSIKTTTIDNQTDTTYVITKIN